MSRVTISERIVRTAPIWLVGLALATAFISVLHHSRLALLIPAGLLAIPVLGRRVLTHPVEVLSLFLFVAVNLDFLKLGTPRLTLDVIVSSALLWTILIRIGLQRPRITFSAVEWAYIAFLAVTVISILVSVSPADSIKRCVREVQYLVFFTFLAGQVVKRRQEDRLVAAVIFSSVIPCITGLIGYVAGIDMLLGQELYLEGGNQAQQRIVATLSHPVTFSLYLSFVGAMTLALILDGRRIARRFLVPVFALQMLALLLSYGRTGWIAFFAAVVCLLWLRGQRRILLPLPLLLIAVGFMIPSFLERWESAFAASDQNSFLWRVGLWMYALQVFRQHPVFGSGLGTFTEHVHYLRGHPPHQTWVGLLVEVGVVGVVAFAVLMAVLGRRLWVRHRDIEPERRPIVQGVIAGWTALIVGSFGANVFGLPSIVVYLWTMAGLCLSVRSSGQKGSHDAQ